MSIPHHRAVLGYTTRCCIHSKSSSGMPRSGRLAEIRCSKPHKHSTTLNQSPDQNLSFKVEMKTRLHNQTQKPSCSRQSWKKPRLVFLAKSFNAFYVLMHRKAGSVEARDTVKHSLFTRI